MTQIFDQVSESNSINHYFRAEEKDFTIAEHLKVINWLLVPGQKALGGNTPNAQQVGDAAVWMQMKYAEIKSAPMDPKNTKVMLLHASLYKMEDAYKVAAVLVPEAVNFNSLQQMHSAILNVK